MLRRLYLRDKCPDEHMTLSKWCTGIGARSVRLQTKRAPRENRDENSAETKAASRQKSRRDENSAETKMAPRQESRGRQFSGTRTVARHRMQETQHAHCRKQLLTSGPFERAGTPQLRTSGPFETTATPQLLTGGLLETTATPLK